jgi:hypothetical protein
MVAAHACVNVLSLLRSSTASSGLDMVVIARTDFSYIRYCGSLPICPVRVGGLEPCSACVAVACNFCNCRRVSLWLFCAVRGVPFGSEDRSGEYSGNLDGGRCSPCWQIFESTVLCAVDARRVADRYGGLGAIQLLHIRQRSAW